jgi:amylosucrase
MAASLVGLEDADGADDADRTRRELALRRLLLLHGLALSFGAMPVLYMGDELGQTNDYSFRDRADRAMDSRWLQRPALDEVRFAQRHDSASPSGRVYVALRALIAARQRLSALAAGAPRSLLDAPPAVLALARGADFLALYNFSGEPQSFALDGRWCDSLTHQARSNEIQIAPWVMHWLERQR